MIAGWLLVRASVQVTAEEFYRAVNVSKPSFIRVEADELTYDYHIMLRVEIESELMDGSLNVAVSGTGWWHSCIDLLCSGWAAISL